MSRPSYEDQARRRKAQHLAAWCRAEGLTATAVVAMSDVTRRQACEDAGVNVASAETWAIVIGTLGAFDEMPAAMRAALPADPFENLA